MQDASAQALTGAVRKAGWRLLPLLGIGYLFSYIDRTECGFRGAHDERGARAHGCAVRLRGRHLLCRLCDDGGTEHARAPALRRTALARADHDHLGPDGGRDGARDRPEEPLRAAPPHRHRGSGLLSGRHLLSLVVVSSEYRVRCSRSSRSRIPLSSVISGPLSAALLGLDGKLGLAGWQWIFLCEGLPSCVLGLWTLLVLPDSPADAHWLTAAEKDALMAAQSAPPPAGVKLHLWSAVRDARVIVLSISYFLLLIGVLGVSLWLPQMLKQHVLSNTRIRLAFGWAVSPSPASAWCYGQCLSTAQNTSSRTT